MKLQKKKIVIEDSINHIPDTIRSSFTSRNDKEEISEKISFYELIDQKTISNIKHSLKILLLNVMRTMLHLFTYISTNFKLKTIILF